MEVKQNIFSVFGVVGLLLNVARFVHFTAGTNRASKWFDLNSFQFGSCFDKGCIHCEFLNVHVKVYILKYV